MLPHRSVLRYMTRSWRGYAFDILLNPESLGSADEHTLIPILVLRG